MAIICQPQISQKGKLIINMTNKLKDRISQARGKAGLSQAKLAELLGIHLTTLSKYENGHRVPDSEILSQIANICQVSPAWLLTGSDSLETQETDKAIPGGRGKAKTVSVPVHAFAGAGSPIELWEHDPIDVVDVPAHWMAPQIHSAIIRGRSMEPTIVDGAVVGIDTQSKQIISGEMYAIWMEYEGAIVKRLYVEKGFVRITSDNPDFPEMKVSFGEINEDSFLLGKVSWLMQSY